MSASLPTHTFLGLALASLVLAGCEPVYGGDEEDEGTTTSTRSASAPAQPCEDCRVVDLEDCHDGDTCRFSGFDSRVRFARIDTPEMDGDCRERAKAARRALLETLRDADDICVTQTGVGYHDRPIVEVCADGRNVNNWLMEQDYAVDYGKPTCERNSPRRDPPSPESDESDDPSGDGVCSAEDVDCSELDSCAEAKKYFAPCPDDPHRLDRDDDGTPCESLCR